MIDLARPLTKKPRKQVQFSLDEDYDSFIQELADERTNGNRSLVIRDLLFREWRKMRAMERKKGKAQRSLT